MQIVCPNCSTSYQVAAASLGGAGRSVRCVRCRSVWFATPEQEPEAQLTAAAAEVAAAGSDAGMAAREGRSVTANDDYDWSAAAESRPETGSDGAADAAPPLVDAGARALAMESSLSHPQNLDALHDAPSLVPADDAGAPDPSGSSSAEDVETAAARRARLQALRRRSGIPRPSMTTVILALMAVIAAILGWRADVVRLMPQTASLFAAIGLPVNLRGLAIDDVKSTKEIQEGVAVLVVEGRIANISKMMLEVPRIRFALRNAAGNEIYNWTIMPTRSILPPGDSLQFRTRLASPPSEGKDVLVRFFNRRDAIGGMR